MIKTCLIAILLWCPARLLAETCGVAEAVPAEVTASYDPFAGYAEGATLRLNLVNTGSNPCEIEITIVDAARAPQPFNLGSLSLGSLSLAVDAAATNGVIRNIDQSHWRVTLSTNSSIEALFLFKIIGQPFVNSGRLSLPLRITVKDLSLASVADSTIGTKDYETNFFIDVLSRAQLTISGTEGAYGTTGTASLVDFGTLETGEERRLYVGFRSTSAAILKISSQNLGRMMRTGVEASQFVDYKIRLYGQGIDLKSPFSQTVAQSTSFDGTSLPLDIIVGDVAGKAAGAYTDLITVEIAPFE
jgi:hypothetical protein